MDSSIPSKSVPVQKADTCTTQEPAIQIKLARSTWQPTRDVLGAEWKGLHQLVALALGRSQQNCSTVFKLSGLQVVQACAECEVDHSFSRKQRAVSNYRCATFPEIILPCKEKVCNMFPWMLPKGAQVPPVTAFICETEELEKKLCPPTASPHLSLSVRSLAWSFPLSFCRTGSSRKLRSRLSSGTKSSTLCTFKGTSGAGVAAAGSGAGTTETLFIP